MSQRWIEFDTDATGSTDIGQAIRDAFAALEQAQPPGVKLAYWKMTGQNRFVALIELDEESPNPLLTMPAAAALPQVIGRHVDGGYPVPQPLKLMGAYGFQL
ncbi:MAG: hypothetical protein ACQET9_10195 [Actinomycetota bacterium]